MNKRFTLLSALMLLVGQSYAADSNVNTLVINPGAYTATALPPTQPDGEDQPGPMSKDVLARQQVSFEITPETTDLLGESIDLGSGAVSFYQTDVSIPGNFDIPVALGREYKGPQFKWSSSIDMGDWMLAIPHIHTTVMAHGNDFSGSWGQGRECSGPLLAQVFVANVTGGNEKRFFHHEYNNGTTLNIPGVGGPSRPEESTSQVQIVRQ